jgi:hypothetical protein
MVTLHSTEVVGLAGTSWRDLCLICAPKIMEVVGGDFEVFSSELSRLHDVGPNS